MDGSLDTKGASRPVQKKHRFQLKPSAPFIWLILSAGLFLLGAASFSGHGARQLAEFGVMGAVMAVAVIAAFLL